MRITARFRWLLLAIVVLACRPVVALASKVAPPPKIYFVSAEVTKVDIVRLTGSPPFALLRLRALGPGGPPRLSTARFEVVPFSPKACRELFFVHALKAGEDQALSDAVGTKLDVVVRHTERCSDERPVTAVHPHFAPLLGTVQLTQYRDYDKWPDAAEKLGNAAIPTLVRIFKLFRIPPKADTPNPFYSSFQGKAGDKARSALCGLWTKEALVVATELNLHFSFSSCNGLVAMPYGFDVLAAAALKHQRYHYVDRLWKLSRKRALAFINKNYDTKEGSFIGATLERIRHPLVYRFFLQRIKSAKGAQRRPYAERLGVGGCSYFCKADEALEPFYRQVLASSEVSFATEHRATAQRLLDTVKWRKLRRLQDIAVLADYLRAQKRKGLGDLDLVEGLLEGLRLTFVGNVRMTGPEVRLEAPLQLGTADVRAKLGEDQQAVANKLKTGNVAELSGVLDQASVDLNDQTVELRLTFADIQKVNAPVDYANYQPAARQSCGCRVPASSSPRPWSIGLLVFVVAALRKRRGKVG